MLILSAADVRRALPMKEAIESQRDAFRAFSSGAAEVPLRSRLGEPGKKLLVMPARVRELLVTKLVTLFDGNPARGLPLIHGLVVLLDPETGGPSALIEGASLTAWRTGAASGAATDVLARRDVRIGAVLGTGAQAETQCLAIASVRSFDEIRVYSRNPEKVRAFAARLEDHVGTKLMPAPSLEAAVRGADVICAATTASEPIVFSDAVSDGAHVSAVGAYTPDAREMEGALLARAGRVFVDSKEAAVEEAGDILLAWKEGRLGRDALTEIGDVLLGRAPGRSSEREVTVFKSVGIAAQDVTVAAAVVKAARARGVGTEVGI